MPRAAGQIDVGKNEAILDAAIELMAERGVGVSLDEVARRAGVSKQTIYNHYGSKADLARAIADRRLHEVRAVLDAPGARDNPAETLTRYARLLLDSVFNARGLMLYRMAIAAVATLPDMALAIYEAGPRASRLRLADYLRDEAAAGRIAVDDPLQAAEFFAGMVLGPYQSAALLGAPVSLTDAAIDRVAAEATGRFLRAYAPAQPSRP